MSRESLYLLMADLVLLVHVMIVIFVVGGLLVIYLGALFNWGWVRSRLFRMLHLLTIGIVVVQSWLGFICPLTTWEMMLREQAGVATYNDSFVRYWMHELLYYQAPEWVFITLYTAFAALVAASWFVVRPRQKPSSKSVESVHNNLPG